MNDHSKYGEISKDHEIACRKRLATLIDAVGNRKYAAKIAGVSEDMLRRYKKDSRIALEPVGKLCDEANISLNWLWSGEGNQYKKSPPSEHLQVKEGTAASDKYSELAAAISHAPNGYKLPERMTALILELASNDDINTKAVKRIIELMADLEQSKTEEK